MECGIRSANWNHHSRLFSRDLRNGERQRNTGNSRGQRTTATVDQPPTVPENMEESVRSRFAGLPELVSGEINTSSTENQTPTAVLDPTGVPTPTAQPRVTQTETPMPTSASTRSASPTPAKTATTQTNTPSPTLLSVRRRPHCRLPRRHQRVRPRPPTRRPPHCRRRLRLTRPPHCRRRLRLHRPPHRRQRLRRQPHWRQRLHRRPLHRRRLPRRPLRYSGSRRPHFPQPGKYRSSIRATELTFPR